MSDTDARRMRAPLGRPVLTRLGRYQVLQLVAQGGMADVYLARQVGIGSFERYVAIKVQNAARATDPDACALFLDEARLLALLSHPNLASVLEVDAQGGVPYLAMEYVHGADLRGVLESAHKAGQEIPYDAALAIVADAATGLDHAHRRCGADGRPLHLVHRDVSLSNIMVGHEGVVKVIDFGIASATVSSHQTDPGIVRGKASYMSPEQCLGDAVDLRTDVFALGIVLYELTTGKRCFPGNSDFERMVAVVRGEYVRPSDIVPDFPAELEEVIAKALALEPDERYASAAELAAALVRVAVTYGWSTGPAVIARLMRGLFGEVPEPWTVAARAEATAPMPPLPAAAEVVALPAPAPTRVITRPRRMPRGTEADVAAPHDADEDAPTRGRRSVPSIWRRELAA